MIAKLVYLEGSEVKRINFEADTIHITTEANRHTSIYLDGKVSHVIGFSALVSFKFL